MNKILIPILILINLNAGTIEPKKVKAKDQGGHHRSSNNIQDDILFSSSEATSHISTELSFALSTEATSYSTMEKKKNRRDNYIETNRKQINLNMAYAGGEHLSALLRLLELKEEKQFLITIQKNFQQLSNLDSQELSKALINIQS